MYYIGSIDDLFDFIIFTFTGSTGIMSLVGIAEIVGMFLLFGKSGVKRSWALAVISLEFIDRDKR